MSSVAFAFHHCSRLRMSIPFFSTPFEWFEDKPTGMISGTTRDELKQQANCRKQREREWEREREAV